MNPIFRKEIELLAYKLWEAHGNPDPVTNWLHAESDIKALSLNGWRSEEILRKYIARLDQIILLKKNGTPQ